MELALPTSGYTNHTEAVHAWVICTAWKVRAWPSTNVAYQGWHHAKLKQIEARKKMCDKEASNTYSNGTVL